MEDPSLRSRADTTRAAIEQGLSQTRLPIRWPDHLLCLHASHRGGQRSSGDLLPLPAACGHIVGQYSIPHITPRRNSRSFLVSLLASQSIDTASLSHKTTLCWRVLAAICRQAEIG